MNCRRCTYLGAYYLPIHIECVFRIQQLSEFASAQTEFSGFKTF